MYRMYMYYLDGVFVVQWNGWDNIVFSRKLTYTYKLFIDICFNFS